MIQRGNTYTCDRCGTQRFVPMTEHNGQLPSDWTSLLVNGNGALDLCLNCGMEFSEFISNRGVKNDKPEVHT